jgi:hypothetical protein
MLQHKREKKIGERRGGWESVGFPSRGMQCNLGAATLSLSLRSDGTIGQGQLQQPFSNGQSTLVK